MTDTNAQVGVSDAASPLERVQPNRERIAAIKARVAELPDLIPLLRQVRVHTIVTHDVPYLLAEVERLTAFLQDLRAGATWMKGSRTGLDPDAVIEHLDALAAVQEVADTDHPVGAWDLERARDAQPEDEAEDKWPCVNIPDGLVILAQGVCTYMAGRFC